MSPEKQLYDEVQKALASGDHRHAILACRQLNTEYPDYFQGWRVAGQIHLRFKKYEAALISTEQALALRPQDIDVGLQRVDSLLALERTEAAVELLRSMASTESRDANNHDQLGRLMASLDMHAEALEQYQKALRLRPDDPTLLYNLATAQRFLGETAAAERSLDEALGHNRFDFEAQAMRSSLRKQTSDDNHTRALQGILDDSRLAAPGRVNICYALAKEFDDLDQPQTSFQYLRRGADLRRSAMNYDVETDLEVIDAIIDTFTPEYFASVTAACESEEPIFILGLPRTGTTLVERILGSHSAIHSAGELDTFGRELMNLLGQQHDPSALSRPDVVRLGATLDAFALGRSYIDATRPMTGHTPRFIDKLPFNYLYAGLIHRALPNAKIVHLTRHPMAACYAIYKQLFRDAYPFSYDFDDLARYYVAYHKLMQHWDEVLPGVIHRLAYEDVVADLEGAAKNLVRFCGLEWEAQCLRFHENTQASTTASASQVRSPVYSSSVDRWRRYESQLQPLADHFQATGIDISGQ